MKAVILCDGRAPFKKRIIPETESADLFIAADGGANTARTLNLQQPDYIIGDLDSYIAVPDYKGRVIEDPGQETNDLEKALLLALEKGVRDVLVFGATGRRLDHTLKNLSVLKQFHRHFSTIMFIDNYGELILLPPRYSATLPPGTVISLFPLSGAVRGITTRGLKYPLEGESLENGIRDGTSNETVDEKIEIIHEKGDLLLFTAASEEY
ncbi:MAG: thiamine diphosphokinase [Balneolaceae bacterium]